MLRSSLRFIAIATTLLAITTAARSAQRTERIARQLDSPDAQLRAVIVALAPSTTYGGEESRVEIRDRKDKVLAAKDFSSSDSNHGEAVDTAKWTPDAQFFVFNVSSSGGHQPWQSPVWFYSRKEQRFRELSNLMSNRPVLSDDEGVFQIIPPHSVKIATWKNPPQPGQSEPDEITVVVDLAASR